MMTDPRLAIKLLNLLNGLVLFVYIVKTFHVFAFLNVVKIYHLAIVIAIIYGLKSWIEVSQNVNDPIKENRLTNGLLNFGFGMIVLGILMRIMHWPFGDWFFLIGAILVLCAYILSFTKHNNKGLNDGVLDDIND